MHSVDQMLKLLNELAPSPLDRTLVFPLFLTGCMSDNQMVREVIKHRLFMQDATMGNVLLAQTVMDDVWTIRARIFRDAPHHTDRVSLPDWRQCLKLEWASLLLA